MKTPICVKCGLVIMQGQSHRWSGGKVWHLPGCVECSVCGGMGEHAEDCYARRNNEVNGRSGYTEGCGMNKPTFADIDKALASIPKPTCYADYGRIYRVLPGGGYVEIFDRVDYTPDDVTVTETRTVNPKKLSPVEQRMTDQQLRDAGVLDITYWLMANPICPTCGLNFETANPAMNLVPHWLGDCKTTQEAA